MNVVNFGSLNIDHVYAVDHFCRAGETIHTKSYTQNAGGKGLNQSIAVSRSGQKVHHAGLLGPEGTRLAELLSGSGVDLRYLKHTDVPQGHAVIQVQPDGQNCIFLYGGSNQAVTPQEIDEVLMQLNAGDYLLLQNEIANLHGGPAVCVPGQGRRHDRRGRYVHGLFRRLPRAGHGTADGHAVCVHGLRHLRHPPRRSSVHPPDG